MSNIAFTMRPIFRMINVKKDARHVTNMNPCIPIYLSYITRKVVGNSQVVKNPSLFPNNLQRKHPLHYFVEWHS